MFNKKIIFLGLVSSLFFLGCSDSKPTDPDREDLSSSSNTGSSSSVSSSSSIDISIPEGAKRATLDDLSKNMNLGTLLGADAYLTVGEKGLFSLWFFVKGGTTEAEARGWIVVQSDFKDGIIQINKDAAVPAFDSSPVGDAIQDMVKKSAYISFIVKKDSTIHYSVNGGDYVKASAVQLIATPGYVSKASVLENQEITCEEEDNSSLSIEFFSDGRFVRKNTDGSASTWSAGLYDVHRSVLFLVPTYYFGATNSLYKFKVENSTLNLDSLSCSKKSIETTIWKKKDIAKAWVALDSLNWTFILNESGSFSLKADRQTVAKEAKTGTWDQFGSYLALTVNTCLDPKTCSAATIGKVVDLDEVGFTYNHSDKTKPMIPTDWDVAELDE